MTHYIRQQYLDVDLEGSESDGFALQHRLSDLYYTQLLPAIENALDQCSPTGKLLVIDRLDIDAGTFDLDRMDQNLATAVAKALIQSIEKEDVINKSRKENNGLKASDNRDTEVNPEVSYLQIPEENLWEVFIHFLSTGSMPWWYRLPANKSLEEMLAEQLVIGETKTSYLIPIAKIIEIFKSAFAAKRLALQFSESFTISLLERISPDTFTELKRLLTVSENLSFAPEEVRLVRKFVLEKMVLLASTGGTISRVGIAKQVHDSLQIRKDLLPLVTKVFKQAWPEIKIFDNETPGSIKKLFATGKNSNPDLLRLDLKDYGSKRSEIKVTEDEAYSTEDRIAEERVRKETAEGIYIDNAGLVLLHPFLPQFFDALGISKEEEIVQPEKALGLLHYLASGQIATPEYEIVLPKIICQVPLTTPISADVEITDIEISEAAALLDAVIKHWEVLRNTTSDGLRGTFLLRPGKLTLKEDGDWLLQVESRTFDILLEHLPWGISMIKLPWMKNMLWVEWSF